MTLDELSKKERELLLQIDGTKGSIEEKADQLKAKGIFDAYKQVHDGYADLAKENNEALKRGLFLQWYALVEPSFLTGINDIDSQAEKEIIRVLDDQIGENEVDAELYSMVSYYADWENVFDRFNGYSNLTQLLKNRLDYDSIILQLKQSDLTSRGQMGIYWQSVIPLR
ncbi:hypothetical protein [Larkinella soli]|uniref:hypothetical protein n=1 Tax=Larkinella soli TaxID=1770527 RepID=UPI000FFBBEFA|nr:hypothetical protein [Larkinella soli]